MYNNINNTPTFEINILVALGNPLENAPRNMIIFAHCKTNRTGNVQCHVIRFKRNYYPHHN